MHARVLPGAAAGAGAERIARGALRAWVAPGVALREAIPPDGDPDHLLTRPDCRIIKLQRKVIVGRVATPGGVLYVKRYNVFAWRLALTSLCGPSPAFAAWRGARALAAAGFATPEVVAAIEFRRAGVLRRSFFVTREVPDAVTAAARAEAILAEPDRRQRRRARRALARTLGELFRRLHAAGLYHNDLKDVNVLVSGPAEAPACTLLDLERVRVLSRVGRRRRLKNLVQLARTLGRRVGAADGVRFLYAYLGRGAGRDERRAWARAVERRAARKDRRSRAMPDSRRSRAAPDTRRSRAAPDTGRHRPRLSCTVVCQDEEAGIGHCLETVTWCDEIVVVDGGSRDRTVAIARRFTDRVLHNPWPGYRAQKQFALDAASGDWVLNVDADERITPELAAEVRAALAHVPDAVAGFAVPRLVCYLGRWWYRGGWYPRRAVRLVRRSATRWGGTDPHDRPEVAGRVLPLRWPILHYTYTDVADHLRSVNLLTTVAAGQGEPRAVGAGRLIAEPVWRFLRRYVLKRGFLDGFPGLFVATTEAFYVFLRWAKVWERARRRLEGDA